MINQLFQTIDNEVIRELPYSITCDKCGGNVRIVPSHHNLDVDTGRAEYISLMFRCTKCGQKHSIIIDDSRKRGN